MLQSCPRQLQIRDAGDMQERDEENELPVVTVVEGPEQYGVHGGSGV